VYHDFSGNLDSCIAIRGLSVRRGEAVLQAGAGVVADSDPAREYQEAVNKSRSVRRAVEVAHGAE
ncbi:MAG TPA: chorismate-binding protein, partial [Elusimicrobiales bacterium]|nr:chorismate-binding protein [Elusimicrobiales bacterium]